MAVRVTQSRSPRQRQLIGIASRLFAQRGYHAVGITDLTDPLGLTGPAFYRHYPSKSALLVAVFEDTISAQLEDIGELVARVRDPHTALHSIVEKHLQFVLKHDEKFRTWRTEFRALPKADRDRLKGLQHIYIETWVRTLRRLRPELPPEHARILCTGAIALVQSPVDLDRPLRRDDLAASLIAMAMHIMTNVSPQAVPAGAAGEGLGAASEWDGQTPRGPDESTSAESLSALAT